MITVASKSMTLEEYLTYSDGSETMHELVNGEWVDMPPESEQNRRIASFLFLFFAQLGISPQQLTMKTEIVVSGARATARFPDLMVLSEELVEVLAGARRSTIMPDMPPPLLVVEVVSPRQEARDYRYKRSEYAARGIAEYWIVDPMAQRLTVLEWVEGLYEEQVFMGDTPIQSPVWGPLALTVGEILQV